jgi:hypothetical protein
LRKTAAGLATLSTDAVPPCLISWYPAPDFPLS